MEGLDKNDKMLMKKLKVYGLMIDREEAEENADDEIETTSEKSDEE